MFYKKEERPLGNEFKNKTVRKNTKYFQSLEYKETKEETKKVKNKEEMSSVDLLVLPIGNSNK